MADLSSAVKSLLDAHHFEDAFALIRYACKTGDVIGVKAQLVQ